MAVGFDALIAQIKPFMAERGALQNYAGRAGVPYSTLLRYVRGQELIPARDALRLRSALPVVVKKPASIK